MYQSNPLLRSATEKIEYTDEMKKEWLRCAEDIFYFAEKYFYVVEIDNGKHVIELRDYQKKMLAAMADPPQRPDDYIPHKQHAIVLASRQIGKSVVCRIILLHFVLFNRDKTAAILANKEKTAHKLMKEFKDSYMQLPMWLQQGVVEGGWNKGEVNFENGVCVVASSTSSNAIRSYSISLLMLDEFAFVPDNIASEFFSSVYPTISSGKKSKVIIVSCVPKDTLLLTDKGPQEIGTLIEDHNNVAAQYTTAYNVEGFKGSHTSTIVVNNGEQETRQITTPLMIVESTMPHEWWSCVGGVYGWRCTRDLKKGDFLAVKVGQNCWGQRDIVEFKPKVQKKLKYDLHLQQITPDLAYFLGLFLAEGSTHRRFSKKTGELIGGSVTITCGDTKDILSLFDQLEFKYYSDGLRHTISSKYLLQWLQALGFDLSLKAPQKIIPAHLMQMSKKNIVAMLQGLFDGDGYSSSYQGRVGINLSSKRMVEQIRFLLLNLGVVTTLHSREVKPTHLVKRKSHSYRLTMHGQQAALFYHLVGFRFERKQSNQSCVGLSFKRNRADVIPFSKQRLRNVKKFDRDAYKQIVETGIFQGNYHCSLHFNRTTMLKHREVFTHINNKDVQCLMQFTQDDLWWVPITAIQSSRAEVVDVSLPHNENDPWCHSVLYNGVVGHQTPNGMNHFYRMWTKAARGDSGYFPIKINYWEVEGRDENWKQETIANLQGGIVEFNQEYGARFLGSSNTLIDPDVLERIDVQSPTMLKWNGALQIFEPPAPAAEYVLGIDPGKGTRRDYSVIQVLRIRSEKDVEQVAIYRNNEIDTHAFSQVCISVSDFYNEAEMMIENNGCGEGLLNTMWYEYECDRIVNCERKGLGVNANKKSKLAANLNTKRYIEEGWCKIHDQTTLYEFSRYIEHKLNIFACETKDGHDDTVTSLNWGLWFLRTPFYTGKRTKKCVEIEDQFKLTEEEKESLPAAIMNEEEEFDDYNEEPIFFQEEGF